MKIGIDGRMWNETGIGRYIRNIVGELAKTDTENQYVIFLLKDDYDSVDLPANFRKVKADIRWHTFSEQLILPFIFLKENLDLLHVPHFNVPLLYPKKFVATIHDLTILRVKTGRATTLPYPFYLMKRFAFQVNLTSTIKRARKIFTVSEFVKHDLMESFGVPEEKLVLTPNAVSESFGQATNEAIAAALTRYKISPPYIFYVGNAHPHKNLERLVKAFEKVSARYPEIFLVFGGKKSFFYERLENEVKTSPAAAKIKFIGFVEDEDLPLLYSGSELFVNPSLYEGFGIQLLEAFACETKVVCSHATSLPEVGKDIAYYFDPRDVENMSATLMFALRDIDPDRKEKGLVRVKEFSWTDSASKVFAVYNSLK